MRGSRIKILSGFILVSLLILGSSFVFPFYMKAVFEEFLTVFWVFITNTGSTTGMGVVIIVTCILLAKKFKSNRDKFKMVLVSWFFFVIILGSFALVNEYMIKENLKVYRPSIQLLQKHYDFDADAFYALHSKPERKQYIKTFFESKSIENVSIDDRKVLPQVVHLWFKETGFSFPSGHSVSSFLLATLLGYILLFYSGKKQIWLIIAIYCWAICVALSRVFLGVHTPIDITLGALWGSVFGLLIIAMGLIDWVLSEKSIDILTYKKRID